MKLQFIYNANHDLKSRVFDFAHKIISPSTYHCSLCHLTHSNFGEREEWGRFVEQSDFEMKFYHKDEFEEKYKLTFDYPLILKVGENGIDILVSKKELYRLGSTQDLIELLRIL